MAKEKKPRKERSRISKIFRWTALVLLIIFLVVPTIFVINVSNNLPPLNDIENPRLDLSSRIYTADGKILGTFHDAENRVYIPLDSMSPWVKPALLATEDIRFNDHCGIDPRTPFTILKDVVTRGRLRGGSSISQQLARNLYNQVGRENSVTRKVKEAIVAIILESRFTKDEIMQAYLNTTTFYGNTYGIEMGAQTLFSKSAADLNMQEAALMVGLLKGPSYYSPTRNEERALNRRNTVLDQMKKYSSELKEMFPELKVTQRKIKKARETEIELKLRRGNSNRYIAPYFRDQVKDEVKAILKQEGLDEKYDLFTDGLRVYTTVDSRMQKYAEKAVKEHLTELQKKFMSEFKRTGQTWKKDKSIVEKAMKNTDRWRSGKKNGQSKKEIKASFDEKHKMRIWTWDGEIDTTMTPKDSLIHYMTHLQTGFMSMDPHTGEIKAWVGGANYDKFKLDHVKKTKRQVGSTFKPIVYGYALAERLHKPCDQVLDVPVSIELPDGKVWRPKNSGGKDDGLITYYEGLARSKNQVTAYLMKEVGPKKICQFARELGIESDLECVPSLCLGTSDISVYEMVGAYSTFANYGMHVEPFLVSRIENKNGAVLYQHQPKSNKVMSPEAAFHMVRMLQGVVDHLRGTGHRLRAKYKFKNQIGGKTGTTQGNSDGWFMGVTPDLVSGVWVGCDDKRLRFRSTRYGQGANMALPIWAIYMRYVYSDSDIGLSQEPFTAPDGYTMTPFCPAPKQKNFWEPGEDGNVDDALGLPE